MIIYLKQFARQSLMQNICKYGGQCKRIPNCNFKHEQDIIKGQTVKNLAQLTPGDAKQVLQNTSLPNIIHLKELPQQLMLPPSQNSQQQSNTTQQQIVMCKEGEQCSLYLMHKVCKFIHAEDLELYEKHKSLIKSQKINTLEQFHAKIQYQRFQLMCEVIRREAHTTLQTEGLCLLTGAWRTVPTRFLKQFTNLLIYCGAKADNFKEQVLEMIRDGQLQEAKVLARALSKKDQTAQNTFKELLEEQATTTDLDNLHSIVQKKAEIRHFVRQAMRNNNNKYHVYALELRYREYPELLAEACEQLASFGELRHAQSIIYRNRLNFKTELLQKSCRQAIAQTDPCDQLPNELITKDAFVPTEHILGLPGIHMSLSDYGINKENILFIDKINSTQFEAAQETVLRRSVRVALDSEGEPVSLLQLAVECTDRTCQLFIFDVQQLQHSKDFVALIKQLLRDSRILKVGAGILLDIKQLAKAFEKQFLETHSCIEIQEVFKALYPQEQRCNLQLIVNLMLGKNLSKCEQQSNWHTRPLRNAQLHYAALDSFALLEILRTVNQNQLYEFIYE